MTEAALHPLAFRGRVETPVFESKLLAGNRAGDPHVREVPVYLPPGAGERGERLPCVWLLASFTSHVTGFLETHPWRRGVVSLYDEAVAAGRAPRAILVLPDCFTWLGGSQYVDSAAVGDYETHVVGEIVPFLDARFRTKPSPRHRGVTGKSSGGYGALMLAMKHPGVFGALASHSGDAYFDYCYRFDFVKCWNTLRDAGGVEKWLAKFRAQPRVKGDDVLALNIVAMSACYSPHADGRGFDLPFDLATGEERADVMTRWRRVDPVVACKRYAKNLRKLRGIYVDCGLKDEFALHSGARILVQRLRALGLKPVHEEFDDGHMGIGYRYENSFPWLGKWIG